MTQRNTAKLGLSIDELIEELSAPVAELPSPAPDTANRHFYSTLLDRALIGLSVAALIAGLGLTVVYLLNNSGSKKVATSPATPQTVQGIVAAGSGSSCSDVAYATFYDGPNLKYLGFRNNASHIIDLGDWVLDHENHPSKFVFPESFPVNNAYSSSSENEFRVIVLPSQATRPRDLVWWEEGLGFFYWMKESNNYASIRLWDTKQNCTLSLINQPALAAANTTPTPFPPIHIDTPTPVPPIPTDTPTPSPPTPTDTPTVTPTPTNTPVPPKPAPVVQTAKPGHYWSNRSVTQGIGGPSLSVTVESIDVLADGKTRLNYYTYNNTCCNWDFAGPKGSYLVDNFGKKYDLINGAGGGTSANGQRIEGWMLFPALQPNATSFSLKYDNRYEIDNIEFISPERHTLNLGNYGIRKSSGSRRDDFILTIDSTDVLEGGKMRLNVSIYNNSSYDTSHNTARGTHIVDNSGRRYDAIYGSGSIFETFRRMAPKERINGWMLFPSLMDGQTEVTLNHPDYKPITFNLQRAG